MRILIISQYFYPEQFLINDIATGLAERGNDVTVITGLPNYPSGKVFAGYKKKNKRKETINGVKVIRCRIIPRGKSIFKLLLNYFSYMKLAKKEVKKHDGEFDIVFLYQLSPILQAFPAIKYGRRNNKKVLCYCLGLAPASGEKVASWFKPMHFFYKRISKKAYKNCDMIAVSSKSFIEYLSKVHGISKERMFYLPQHAPDNLLSLDLTKSNDDGVTNFMFAGNLGIGSKLDVIIRALSIVKNNGLSFKMHFVGEGRAKQQLCSLVEELDLGDSVVFHDRVDISEMPSMYRLADAFVVTLRKNQITIPSKVQSYMAAGKPIFGCMDGSGKELIEESHCGKCVFAEDVKGFAELLSDFIMNSNAYCKCGEDGRSYFKQHFTLDNFLSELEHLFERAIQGSF